MKEKNSEGENDDLIGTSNIKIFGSEKPPERIIPNIVKPEMKYTLPPKEYIKIKINDDNLINNEKVKLKNKELEILKINQGYLESKLWLWKLDNNFKFDLPSTIFTKKKVIDNKDGFQYKNRGLINADNDIIGKSFSRQILSQIWNKGEFNIESNIPDFPYTWHITSCMIAGYDNIKETYYNILATSFMFIYTLKYRFAKENYNHFFQFSFLSAFYHFLNTFKRLIDLFFGYPIYKAKESSDEKRDIQYQRINFFISNNKDFDFEFFNEKTKEELKSFDTRFELKWNQEILPIYLNQYSNLSKQEIAKNLVTQKLEKFLEFLNCDEEFTKFIKKHPNAIDYLSAQQVINDVTFQNLQEKNNQIKNYQKQLKQNYIKYLSDFWYHDKMEEFESEINKFTEEKIKNEIIRKIIDKKDPYCVYCFNMNNEKESDIINKYNKNNKIPKHCYNARRNLCCDDQELILGECEIKSTFCFWRVVLFILIYFYDLCDFDVFIFRFMVNSIFGIKALCTVNDENVTFPGTLRNLWIYVRVSRDEFENAPDDGILGKCCLRLFHLLYFYIFLLLIIGILLCIFYPIMIFLNVTICLFLIIISPLIIIIWVLLDYLYTIIIYNRFEKDSKSIFPFFNILFVEFSYGFLFQLLAVCFLLIFQPILSFLVFILAQLYFIIRLFFSCIFFGIISCCGRVPNIDTCVAWKTAGPELFKERYYDLSNENILYLVIGFLEQKEMEKYLIKMESMIDSPLKEIEEINFTFGKLGFQFIPAEDIENSIDFYINKLHSQIQNRDIYPHCNLRVKFTRQRLQDIKNMISLYLAEYSKIHDLTQELQKHKNINEYAEYILKNIFNDNILTPLESAEKLTKVKSIFEDEMDLIAKKIFENPYFQDKIIVEENINDIKEEDNSEIIVNKAANFEEIFKGKLKLVFFPFTEKEIEEILIRSENILTIKSKTINNKK